MYEPRHKIKKPEGKLGFFICALSVLAMDQLSKNYILSALSLQESLPLIPDFFHLTYIRNSGVSFGMLQDKAIVFTLASGLVIFCICWAAFFWKGFDRLTRILFGFITGGALGNLADRLRYGAVVDFLDFRGIWPYIFNLADMAVVCGGIILALVIVLSERNAVKEDPKH